MKTLGIIGGLSPESTAVYYQRINAGVRARKGGLHSAPLIVWSFDFGAVSALQQADRADEVAPLLVDAAQRLERTGADGVLLACNAEHRAADHITSALSVPFLHIADGVGNAIKAAGHRHAGLIGTRFVIEDPFYKDYLESRFGLDVVMPAAGQAAAIHEVIIDELVKGQVTDRGRTVLVDAAAALQGAGAECAVLACTELEMIADPAAAPVPYFDSTALHIAAAVDFITGDA